jgi:hypothetical protein
MIEMNLPVRHLKAARPRENSFITDRALSRTDTPSDVTRPFDGLWLKQNRLLGIKFETT